MPPGGVFSTFNLFRGFSRGMGRADAYFHAGFAGILVLGVVFIAPAADALWEGLNHGVRCCVCFLKSHHMSRTCSCTTAHA